jgi:RNA polymerase sigma factor (sigma-70 family)
MALKKFTVKTEFRDFQERALLFQKTGDIAIFNELYYEIQFYLKNFLRGKFKRASEADIRQAVDDSLISIWINFSKYDQDKALFKTWISWIGYRYLLAQQRTKVNRATSLFSEIAHSSKSEAEGSSYLENIAYTDPEEEIDIIKVYDFEKDIAELPKLYRDILWDKYVLKKSYKEMSAANGVPRNTLKTRARKGLMTIANKYGVNNCKYSRFIS